MSAAIFTIGHGSRDVPEFARMLEDAGVKLLVDVRARPASRRHPQFARAPLAQALLRHGIAYVWEGEYLGGFREVRPDSPNAALNEEGFRGYADHMASAPFKQAIARLLDHAQARPLGIMCAERDPAHCHRSLIADWLTLHGAAVTHLLAPGASAPHSVHPGAKLAGENVVYENAQCGLNFPPAGGKRAATRAGVRDARKNSGENG